jgi:predicted metalloprotease with PDZ domain
MSIMIKKFFIAAAVISAVLLAHKNVFAQTFEARIRLAPNGDLRIEGSMAEQKEPDGKHWSFRQTYADAENLARRIEDLRLFDRDGNEIPYKEFAAGEFVAERRAEKFSYRINLEPSENTISNAHISWLSDTRGLLMPNDLLPQFGAAKVSAKISFDLPEGWKISTNEEKVAARTFLTEDAENAVFLIGRDYREREIVVDKTRLTFTIFGEWQFGDDLASEMTEEILREYAELFGGIPVSRASVFLLPFPQDIGLDRWRAETRGRNIVILSSRMIAESFARQRLHEQLRHELFHLWIPNALDLSGDYAWFYEGFAVYQALKTGLGLGQIRFEDFLNTLEQANFLEQKRNSTLSLIEGSRARWSGEDAGSVYAKGLLVAFLCDAALLEKSRGRRDLKDVFRDLYRTPGVAEKREANPSVLKVLKGFEELSPIVARYVEGTEKIEWAKYLAVFGIENAGNGTNANLTLKSKLSGREKALLKKLGYNNRRNFKRQEIIRNVN